MSSQAARSAVSSASGPHNSQKLPKRRLQRRNSAVSLRTPIAEELPHIADLADEVEVHVGYDDVVLSAPLALSDELPARIDEVALAIELTNPPGFFPTWPIDRADEVLVCYRMRRLLEL